MRPTWDNFFLDLAVLWSTMSTCSRRQVGAVVVQDRKVIGNGFNGVASGKTHCIDGGCPRGAHYRIRSSHCVNPDVCGSILHWDGYSDRCSCGQSWPCPDSAVPGSDYNINPCYAVHAEHNAILQAGLERCLGATIYVTDAPCQQCTNLIEHAKIARVVIMGDHDKNDDGEWDGGSGTGDQGDEHWEDEDDE